jgi:hypothetical protein
MTANAAGEVPISCPAGTVVEDCFTTFTLSPAFRRAACAAVSDLLDETSGTYVSLAGADVVGASVGVVVVVVVACDVTGVVMATGLADLLGAGVAGAMGAVAPGNALPAPSCTACEPHPARSAASAINPPIAVLVVDPPGPPPAPHLDIGTARDHRLDGQ